MKVSSLIIKLIRKGADTIKIDIDGYIQTAFTNFRTIYREAVLSIGQDSIDAADKIYEAAERIRDAGNVVTGGAGGAYGGAATIKEWASTTSESELQARSGEGGAVGYWANQALGG